MEYSLKIEAAKLPEIILGTKKYVTNVTKNISINVFELVVTLLGSRILGI